MEVKKTPKANLENKKPTWLLTGYVVVLALMFVAFEWTRDVRVDTSGGVNDPVFEQEIEIPITTHPEVTPPPPPKPVLVVEQFTIVENDDDVDDVDFVNTEETGGSVDIVRPVVVDEVLPVEDEVFVVVEEMPKFADGGQAGLLQYLGKNMKYPAIPQETGIQGRVTVQFVVNKDGSIVDVTVLRGIDSYLDKEAVRVISGMPKWIPGKQRGKPVRCKFTVPVVFKLQ